MDITIDIQTLKENELSISEYIYLKALYDDISDAELRDIMTCIDRVEEDTLQEKGFIKMMADGKVVLRKKGQDMFDSGNLFSKFMVMFPLRAPSGRFLSPATEETVKGRTIRQKWDKAFKGNPHKERRAIQVLEAELEWRRKNNKLEFIHNAETWLHQGDYENFEYLLEEKQERKENAHKDFL